LVRIDGHRIVKVYGTEGDFTAIPDGETGAAYIKPMNDKDLISLFVTDGANRTWRLLLSVSNAPADTIVIEGKKKASQSNHFGRDMERNRAIKYMILALGSPDRDVGMEIRTVNRTIPLWNDALFILTALVQGQYSGEKYRLTNISNRQMVIDERELYRQGVVAISVERPVLNPGETSDVYVILESE